MKIIGLKARSGQYASAFIVEMSASELDELINKSGQSSRVGVGDEINVHGMYKKLQWLDRNADSIESVVAKLRETADTLEPIHTFTKFFCEGGK